MARTTSSCGVFASAVITSACVTSPPEASPSAASSRPTLLGWDGHEVQWRGRDYGPMAAGRPEGVAAVYRAANRAALLDALDVWRVHYVFVGPVERRHYRLDDAAERRMREALDLVFERGDMRLYRRRTLG